MHKQSNTAKKIQYENVHTLTLPVEMMTITPIFMVALRACAVLRVRVLLVFRSVPKNKFEETKLK